MKAKNSVAGFVSLLFVLFISLFGASANAQDVTKLLLCEDKYEYGSNRPMILRYYSFEDYKKYFLVEEKNAENRKSWSASYYSEKNCAQITAKYGGKTVGEAVVEKKSILTNKVASCVDGKPYMSYTFKGETRFILLADQNIIQHLDGVNPCKSQLEPSK